MTVWQGSEAIFWTAENNNKDGKKIEKKKKK